MKKKTNQSTMNKIVSGLIGGLILWSILNFVVKPLVEGKKNDNSLETFKKLQENQPSECKLFMMSIQECNFFKENGELPERVKEKIDLITKIENK